MRTYRVTYEPMLANPTRGFHRAGYTETVYIDANDHRDAVRRFKQGTYTSEICYAEVVSEKP